MLSPIQVQICPPPADGVRAAALRPRVTPDRGLGRPVALDRGPGREEDVGEAGDAAQHRLDEAAVPVPAQPQRDVRLLHGARQQPQVGDAVQASVEGDAVLGEQAPDDLHTLVGQPAAPAAIELERGELVEEIADAQAERDTPPESTSRDAAALAVR